MDLNYYYQTTWWVERSKKFRMGKVCSKCGSSRELHVHHKKYRFYREKDKDLMVLCQSCHLRGVHKQKTEEDLLDFTS